jgi:hypothetical protein
MWPTIPGRRSQALAQSDFAPLGCGPGLISDPVDQVKSVAFSVEGNAHYQKLPNRFPPVAVSGQGRWCD